MSHKALLLKAICLLTVGSYGMEGILGKPYHRVAFLLALYSFCVLLHSSFLSVQEGKQGRNLISKIKIATCVTDWAWENVNYLKATGLATHLEQ